MKSLLKNLGVILIFATENVNNNAILGTSFVLIIVGLISYIVINKRITD